MIDFVIYEDEKHFRKMYISVISKILANKKSAYKITELDHYDVEQIKEINKKSGKKIYILDIEVPGKNGIDLAREIRNKGDWSSPIIMITTHEYLKESAYTSKILMLDFISKFYMCEESLKEAINISLNILTDISSLNFKYDSEIYQIPYDKIYYIEKNIDNPYSTIVTKDDRLCIKKSMTDIANELEKDERFFRTHRSCIVNIDKIISVELKNCIIHFNNDIETSLLSRNKKQELKDKITNKNIGWDDNDRIF